jgi:hypothetical protein
VHLHCNTATPGTVFAVSSAKEMRLGFMLYELFKLTR